MGRTLLGGFAVCCLGGRRIVGKNGRDGVCLTEEGQFRTRVEVVGHPSVTFVRESVDRAWRGNAEGGGGGSALFAQRKESDGTEEGDLLRAAGFVEEDEESLIYLGGLTDGGTGGARGNGSLSHASIRVVSMDRSLQFYGMFGFQVTRRFLTSGVRAAWLSSQMMTLELIEVPESEAPPPHPLWEDAYRRGIYHICFDITRHSSSLTSFLHRVSNNSAKQFGRRLKILSQPRQQMMHTLVCEVAFIADPDGTIIELLRQSTELTNLTMEPDW